MGYQPQHAATALALLAALSISAPAARLSPDPKTAPVLVYFSPRASVAPELDGKLDDACWKIAPIITDFGIILRGEGAAKKQAFVRMVHDDQAVYVSFRFIEPQMKLLRVRTKDDYLWRCDSLEIYLRPDLASRTRYHLVTNVAGRKFDAWVAGKGPRDKERADPSWKGEKWRAAGRRGKTEWTVEVMLPYSEFGIRPGRPFTVNLVRLTSAGGREYSAWAHAGVDQKDFRFWGHVIFAAPGQDEIKTVQGLVPDYKSRVVSWPTEHGLAILDHGRKKETRYSSAGIAELKDLDAMAGRVRLALGRLPKRFPPVLLSKELKALLRRRDALAHRIRTERFSAVGRQQLRRLIEAATAGAIKLEWEVRCQQLASAAVMQAD